MIIAASADVARHLHISSPWIIGGGGALVAAFGIWLAQRNRRRDNQRMQSRQIAGHVNWHPGNVLIMTLSNASHLPIMDVRGFAREEEDTWGLSGWISFPPIVVDRDGSSTSQVVTKSGAAHHWRFEMEFDDKDGHTWLAQHGGEVRRVRHKKARAPHPDVVS